MVEVVLMGLAMCCFAFVCGCAGIFTFGLIFKFMDAVYKRWPSLGIW